MHVAIAIRMDGSMNDLQYKIKSQYLLANTKQEMHTTCLQFRWEYSWTFAKKGWLKVLCIFEARRSHCTCNYRSLFWSSQSGNSLYSREVQQSCYLLLCVISCVLVYSYILPIDSSLFCNAIICNHFLDFYIHCTNCCWWCLLHVTEGN